MAGLKGMPRQINTVIELNERQTAEFLESLSHPKNAKNREELFRRADSAKFKVVW